MNEQFSPGTTRLDQGGAGGSLPSDQPATATSPAEVIAGLRRASNSAAALGAFAGVVCLAGAFSNRGQFFHSWLVSWLFFCGLSLGSLVIVMMQALTGGAWAQAIQHFCRAAMRTLPLVTLLFFPVLIGAPDLYPWADPFKLAAHPAWVHKAAYLNLPFFAGRALFILTALSMLALLVSSDSRFKGRLSAGGLVAYVICMNFASTDWVMSLEPGWFSTIFVIIFVVQHFVTALALMIVLQAVLAVKHPRPLEPIARNFHDLGNLLLAFIFFWAYVSYSQFLIIWSGNLPKEISWYLHRNATSWKCVAVFLMVFQFLIPFALLLLRKVKRQPRHLGWVAGMILLASLVNTYWLVAPAFAPAGVSLHWLDFATLLAVGGFWSAWFARSLATRPLDLIAIANHG